MRIILSTSLLLPLFMVAAEYLSPIDVDAFGDGKRILITQHTGRRIEIFDGIAGKIIRSIKVKEKPTGAVYSRAGEKIYVTSGGADGWLTVFDVQGRRKRRIRVGHAPGSPVLSPDGAELYVCNRFDNSVSVINLDKSKQVCAIPVAREPVACAVTPDGRFLYVANHLPDGRADADYVASKVSVIDLEKRKVTDTIGLINGAESLRGICVSPDGRFVFATHLMARFLVPTTQIERGWINTNAVSIIRTRDRKLLVTVLLDDVDMGFANPWAVGMAADGSVLAVTSAGNSELRLIDLPALFEKVEAAVSQLGGEATPMDLNVHNDLSFIADVSQRVRLKGLGPRSLCIIDNAIYVGQYFSDALCKITFEKTRAKAVNTIPLGPATAITQVRQGEINFNDATLCFQKWQSCASCHPDARTDALNWDLLNDGIGNPKNVKSMLFSHQTPPVMALGVRDKAETAVRAGIKYIQFAVRPDEDAQAIDAYLRSLEQVPSPRLTRGLLRGRLSRAARRGKKIFQQAGCISCHPAPLFTDLDSYDVGTGSGQDIDKAFDVPSLREAWRTAPYMHDGRAVSIYEVIKNHNPSDRRGKTSGLTEKQIRDLVEYVESL